MGWQDPRGPWQAALRRRLRWWYFVSAVLVFGSVVLTVFLWYLDSRGAAPLGAAGSNLGGVRLVLFSPAAVLAVSLVPLVWGVCRESRVLRLVPEHNGLVCPGCRTVLTGLPPQGECPGCEKPYDRERLETYWEHYALAPASLKPWGDTAPGSAADEDEPRTERRKLVRKALILVGLTLLGVLVPMLMTHGTFLNTLVTFELPYISMFVIMGGVGLLVRARRRRGVSRHCAVCDYQQAPGVEAPARCPECGAAWTEPGAIVRGRRGGSSRLLVGSGVACVVIGGLLELPLLLRGPLGAQALAMKAVPTGTLIAQVTRARGFDLVEWGELRARTLTPEQERRLASGLLDKRKDEGILSHDAGAWFTSALQAGRIPPELRVRYFQEMLELWVVAPQEVRVGQSFQISLGSEFRRSGAPVGNEEAVYFGGFFVGAADTAVGRAEDPNYASLLDDAPYTPTAEVVAEAPGRLRIRAKCWFAVGPRLIWNAIQWQPDGTPAIPATVEWSERREVERTVLVRP